MSIMKLSFIGIGNVGFALADNLQKKGHQVIIAHNNPGSDTVKMAIQRNSNFVLMPVQEAVNKSDVVFLATPFGTNKSVLDGIRFNGKLLIDCTNPVGPGLSHGLKSEISGSEVVQQLAPDSKVVKAFTIYGYENFVNSSYPGYHVKPVMLIAGDDVAAKQQATELINEMGYFAKDTGPLSQALHLEHMTLLWVKMVRLNGHSPYFTWAYLERS